MANNISLMPVEKFFDKFKSATRTRSKEIRLSLEETSELVASISAIIARMSSNSEEIIRLQKEIIRLQKEMTITGNTMKDFSLHISGDGGNF